jgi:hypothetical protein
MFYNHKTYDFINQRTLSIKEIKKLLEQEIQVSSDIFWLHKYIVLSFSTYYGHHVVKLVENFVSIQFENESLC